MTVKCVGNIHLKCQRVRLEEFGVLNDREILIHISRIPQIGYELRQVPENVPALGYEARCIRIEKRSAIEIIVAALSGKRAIGIFRAATVDVAKGIEVRRVGTEQRYTRDTTKAEVASSEVVGSTCKFIEEHWSATLVSMHSADFPPP